MNNERNEERLFTVSLIKILLYFCHVYCDVKIVIFHDFYEPPEICSCLFVYSTCFFFPSIANIITLYSVWRHPRVPQPTRLFSFVAVCAKKAFGVGATERRRRAERGNHLPIRYRVNGRCYGLLGPERGGGDCDAVISGRSRASEEGRNMKIITRTSE